MTVSDVTLVHAEIYCSIYDYALPLVIQLGCFRIKVILQSGPDWSCGQDQIGLFLKIDLATGNHVSHYHL